jgi:hypothetical protein
VTGCPGQVLALRLAAGLDALGRSPSTCTGFSHRITGILDTKPQQTRYKCPIASPLSWAKGVNRAGSLLEIEASMT